MQSFEGFMAAFLRITSRLQRFFLLLQSDGNISAGFRESDSFQKRKELCGKGCKCESEVSFR